MFTFSLAIREQCRTTWRIKKRAPTVSGALILIEDQHFFKTLYKPMEFPAIERQRNSRKCNISASQERHSLGQDKVCSVLWEVARTLKRLEFTCRFILGPHLTNRRFWLMILSSIMSHPVTESESVEIVESTLSKHKEGILSSIPTMISN